MDSSQPELPSPFHNTVPQPILITQGAEALLYRTHFISTSIPAALKVRPSKPYRHPTLDSRLTKQRVLAEARVLVKLSGLASEGVRVPAVLSLEWDLARKVKGLSNEQKGERGNGGGAWLMMEWIEGKSVKELFREWDVWYRQAATSLTEEQRNIEEEKVKILLRQIGRVIGAMHSKGGVIHGDLTSSNIMVRPEASEHEKNGEPEGDEKKAPAMTGEIVLIDFGLGVQSIQDEDRAVDLYVLERAFGSTHPRQEDWFDAEVLQHQDGYRGSYKGANIVLKRLEDVRMRGRKRSMIG